MPLEEKRDMWLSQAKKWESMARGRKSKNKKPNAEAYEYCMRNRDDCLALAKECEYRIMKGELSND